MNPVSIVIIKNKIPLYKGDEQANSIEVIELEEVGFELVANKTLYQIGDRAVYIQPDYCVSDIPLFESFIRPNGDESKSMLGKVEGLPRRIRAKKFNLSKIPNGDPVYSNGILLPYNEVKMYLQQNDDIQFIKGFGLDKVEYSLNDFDLTEKQIEIIIEKLKLIHGNNETVDIKVGQIWLYKTRINEEDSKIKIFKIDNFNNEEVIN